MTEASLGARSRRLHNHCPSRIFHPKRDISCEENFMAHRSAFLPGLALVGVALLSGCAGWSYRPPIHGNYPSDEATHTKLAADAPPAGGNFIQESAHDYAGLVDMLARLGDRNDVDYFARKGIVAERGEIVPPEDNSNWAIPLEQP